MAGRSVCGAYDPFSVDCLKDCHLRKGVTLEDLQVNQCGQNSEGRQVRIRAGMTKPAGEPVSSG